MARQQLLFDSVRPKRALQRKSLLKKERTLTVAGLFAGIGGIEVGFHLAGHSTRLLCEFFEPAQSVLQHHFPKAEIVPDVRSLKALPSVDLVSAGFPCQDLSQAGRTKGITGEQSGLVGHVFRLIDQMKPAPRWLLLENVPFMLQLEAGAAMSYLTAQLEERGYFWAYRVVDTRSFGLPQRRRRVILLASQDPTYDPRTVLFADESVANEDPGNVDPVFGFYWTEGVRGLGWAVDAVPTLKGGSTVGIPSPPGLWYPGEGFFTPTIEVAERLQGFAPGWTEVATEGSNSKNGPRWKLVGNAVSVPVSEWIGRRLVEPGEASGDEIPFLKSRSWPTAASGGPRLVAQQQLLSEWPLAAPRQALREFVGTGRVELSDRALKGFFERLSKGSLRLDERPKSVFFSELKARIEDIRRKENN